MLASLINFFPGFKNLHSLTEFLLFMEWNALLAHGVKSLYAFKNGRKEIEKV